jgi:hypothetical protein
VDTETRDERRLRAIADTDTDDNTNADANTNNNIRQVNVWQLEGRVFFMKDANGAFIRVKLAGKGVQLRKNETLSQGEVGTNINPIHDGTKT